MKITPPNGVIFMCMPNLRGFENFVLLYEHMQWFAVIVVIVVVGISIFMMKAPAQEGVAIPRNSDGEIKQEVTKIPDTKENNVPAGTSLDLSDTQLARVPSYVFDQRNLTHLNVSNNLLTGALQAEIRHLSNLKVLNLGNNQFTGVPAEVGQLDQLEELDLSGNQLTGLPHEIGNLKKLKTLNLRGNDPSEYDFSLIRESLSDTTILLD